MKNNPYKLITFAALAVLLVGTALIFIWRQFAQPDIESVQVTFPVKQASSKEEQDKAKFELSVIKLNSLKDVVTTYNLLTAKSPQSLQEIVDCKSSKGEACLPFKEEDFHDRWGIPFAFERNGQTCTITSLGKDGTRGGTNLDKDTSVLVSPC